MVALPDGEVPLRLTVEGQSYHQYRLSRLVSAKEVDEAIVYAADAPSPAEEALIFHTLYPGVGGVFQIERTARE